LKAYVGFSSIPEDKKIITGNWGCGVFKGNVQLKLIIQWIAASLAGKDMTYCPYGEEKNVLNESMDSLFGKNISKVYQKLLLAA